MNKILIVGHESSHYKDLEQILFSYGMAQAKPSHNYQMTPIELCVKLLSTDNTTNSFYQKKPKKIWDNLAFDLLFANSKQSFWGWADSNAISLLEYWANFDEDIIFILTYDRPYHAIKNLLTLIIDNNLIDNSLIQEKITEWIDYNKILIAFYHKYKKRCLLVNGEQAIHSVNDYIDSLSQKFSCNINPLTNAELDDLKQSLDYKLYDNTNCQEIIDFFIQLQSKYEESIKEFIKMQNIADIPLIKENKPEINTEFLLQQAIYQKITLTTLKKEINQHQKVLEQANQKLIQIQQQLKNREDNEKYLKEQLRNLKKDNNIVINQLYQAQKELEKHYSNNQKFEENNKQTKLLINHLHQAQGEVEKLYLENQLLKSNKSKPNHNNIKEENDLLIAQLHQIQGELEKLYLEKQILNRAKSNQSINKGDNLPYYGAANQIKQDLPYRLGALMISSSKSVKSLIKLPFTLRKEYLNFQKNQKKFPVIESYQDAHEVEKVKKHLSYKLGNTLINGMKTPKTMVLLPIKLIQEVINFKKQKKYK